MRFIDDKGRLFGIVNILDLFAIIFIAFLIVSVGINMFTKEKPANPAIEKTFMVTVVFSKVNNEIANNKTILKPGETDIFKKISLEKVLEIRPVKTGYSDIVAVFKVNGAALNNDYFVGNILIKIGYPFTFTSSAYVLYNGTIVESRIVSKDENN